ncbi:MAG: hypothetical protein ACRD6R_01665 [Candidatus Polarisedimenticolia bacterium]
MPVLIRLLLLSVLAALLLLRRRSVLLKRRFTSVLAVLAGAALVGHIEWKPFVPIHYPEFFHYYLNTKHFAELGYAGLYDASVRAESEDAPDGTSGDGAVRSLETYAFMPRDESLRRSEPVRARFSAPRWAAFKEDVAYFRARAPDLWRSGALVQDHGYNGTPLVTAVLGGLARQPLLPTDMFITTAAWLDLALLIAAAWFVARWIGARQALLFVFLWAANPFNDYAMTGGAYLRHLHVFVLLAALAAWRVKRGMLSGTLFSIAVLLRVFPIFLVAGMLTRDLLRRDRAAVLRSHRAFYGSLAAGLTTLVLLTSLLPSPGGGGPWGAFLGKIGLHAGKLSPNVISLRYPFMYAGSHNAAALVRDWQEGRPRNWIDASQKTFAARFPLYAGLVAGLMVALAFFLRAGSTGDGWLAGLITVFMASHLSHYDYVVLSLVPFFFREPWRALLPLLAAWMAAALWCLLPSPGAIVDLKFCGLSVILAAGLGALVALRSRTPAPGSPA